MMLLSDDNVRILIFTIVLLVYMVIGAYLFRTIESNSNEIRSRSNLSEFFADFNSRFNCNIRSIDYREIFERFSQLYAIKNGYRFGRLKASGITTIVYETNNDVWDNNTVAIDPFEWDLAGSFYFVSSIVTTIGYGNITPQTKQGKALVIVFGFFGCAGGILYFNLCLERNITFWAYVLRRLHHRTKISRRSYRRGSRIDPYKRQSQLAPVTPSSASPYASSASESNRSRRLNWKPNVYWVLVALTCSSIVVLCASAFHYSLSENWTFFEAFYFSFVSFTTIGFGDYVITQRNHSIFTKITNFLILVFGCSCLYSLLNVTSIVIKRFLNMFVQFVRNRRKRQLKTQKSPNLPSARTFTNTKSLYQTKLASKPSRSSSDDTKDTKPSDILTINQFLQSKNFSNLAMIAPNAPLAVDNSRWQRQQQQQQQSGQRHRYRKRKQLQQQQHNYKFFHKHNFIPALVGSLAIVSEKISTTN